MKDMTFQILDDHTEEIQNATEEAVERALEAVGIDVANFAASKCPVDTGLLRNSITYAVSGKEAAISTYHASYGSNRTAKGNRRRAYGKNAGSVGIGRYSGTIGTADEKAVYVGSNVEYAPYVEMGAKGGKVPAQPFLKPAFENHKAKIKQLFLDALNDVL